MKGLIPTIAIVFTLPLTAYQYKDYNNDDLETQKYVNFLTAVENTSTFSYFTVIKVKNLNTGETKDICTKGNFIAGAIHCELKLDYDQIGESKAFEFAKSKRDRYFEFRNQKALDNISFFEYRTKLVSQIKTQYNFGKVIDVIRKDSAFSIRLSDAQMKAFAHVLFNKGYLTGENNCYGGILVYIDRSTVSTLR